MILIHVIAGGIAILAGFASLFLAKGSARHRRAGNVYVLAMLVMTVSAFVIAVFLRPNPANVLASLLTSYLVASAWMTVRRQPARPGLPEYLVALVGAAATVHGLVLVVSGGTAFAKGIGFVFGAIAAAAVIGDVRIWLRHALSPTQRLVRHLWRMTFPFFVATASLFLGQMKHLPTWLTANRINVAVVLIALALLVYWPIRVRFPPWRRPARAAVGVSR